MNSSLKEISMEIADTSDEKEIQELNRLSSMKGAIHIAFLKNPSFFNALQVLGSYTETMVCKKGKEIIGIGNRSIKTVYINGKKEPIGYLSNLRKKQDNKNATAFAKGYEFLGKKHKDGKTKLYLSTIFEANKEAIEILTSKRAGLPIYQDFGRFCCFAVAMKRNRKAKTKYTVRTAKMNETPQIVEFLQKEGKKKQFFPYYTEEDILAEEGLLKGLDLSQIFLAFCNDELVGITAAWNQQDYKQTMITGYSKKFWVIRPIYNIFAKLAGYPKLPKAGSILDYFSLGLICIKDDDNDVFDVLISNIIANYKDSYSFFMAGLYEDDTLLPTLKKYRNFSYNSRLYVVFWEEEKDAFLNLDKRIPYLELGSL